MTQLKRSIYFFSTAVTIKANSPWNCTIPGTLSLSMACKNPMVLSYENSIYTRSAIPKKHLTTLKYTVILNIVHIGVMR